MWSAEMRNGKVICHSHINYHPSYMYSRVAGCGCAQRVWLRPHPRLNLAEACKDPRPYPSDWFYLTLLPAVPRHLPGIGPRMECGT